MQVSDRLPLSLKRIIEQRGYIDIPSTGTSMYPLIGPGNICRFVPVEEREIKKGDILLYVSHSGALVGHRFYQIINEGQHDMYICKGDSNLGMDAPISSEQLLGRMISIRTPRYQIRSDSLFTALWGKLIVTFPMLSAIIHYYVKRKQ